MIYRLAGHHATLVVATLCIMTGAAGIMTEQVQFLATNHHMNFIPAEVGMEENVAILIAAFGVFLEHRRYLLEKVYAGPIPEPVDAFDRYSHGVGIMFLMIAILMEALNLLFLAMNTWGFDGPVVKYTEIAFMFALNVLAIVQLAVFGLRALR